MIKRKTILLLDIDHVVSDASWRDGMIGVESWDDYHLAGDKDPPILETIHLVQDLYGCGWSVIGLTARPTKWRRLTMDYMVRHRVPFDELLMRPENDRRRSPEVKVSLVQERFKGEYDDIAMVLDDRADVVEAFRAIGITAFQIFAKMTKKVEYNFLAGEPE